MEKKIKIVGVRDGRGIAGDISSVQTDRNLCWNIRKCIQLLSGVWKYVCFLPSRKPMG